MCYIVFHRSVSHAWAGDSGKVSEEFVVDRHWLPRHTANCFFFVFLIVKNIFVTRNTIKTGEEEEIVIQKLFTEM